MKVVERRIELRWNNVFPVVVSSEIFGDSAAVARNISRSGMLVEMVELLPLGSVVTVYFSPPDGPAGLCARAEVKHHYCLNYAAGGGQAATRGIGLRFREFVCAAGREPTGTPGPRPH